MKDLISPFFQKKDQLTITNPLYKQLVSDLFLWLVANDQVAHDLTTTSLFSEGKQITASIITRQEITVAGLEELSYLLQTHTNLTIKVYGNDGDHLSKEQTLAEITGDIREILSYERVLLNILQRFCGIATETATILTKLGPTKTQIAATRKTHWGLLDKKAVAVGGGLTHRLNLSDGILVKDNHLLMISPTDTLKKLLQSVNDTLIEIEVEDNKTLLSLTELFSQTQTTNVLGILLDNFLPDEAKTVLAKLPRYENIIFEASGGITAENVKEWAQTGVDVISLGALTHSPKSANLSLEIRP